MLAKMSTLFDSLTEGNRFSDEYLSGALLHSSVTTTCSRI